MSNMQNSRTFFHTLSVVEPITSYKEGLELLKVEMYKLKVRNCYGCANDCPSLKDHDCYESDLDELYKEEILNNLYSSNKITVHISEILSKEENGPSDVKSS
jgi:hypothetical protein